MNRGPEILRLFSPDNLTPAGSLLMLLNGTGTPDDLDEWECDLKAAAHLLSNADRVELACLASLRRAEMEMGHVR